MICNQYLKLNSTYNINLYFKMNDSDTEFFCQSCFDDITNENMVKYKINNDSKWLTSNYCESCVDYLQENSWKIFTDQVEKADCKKALQKILMLDLLLIYVINQDFLSPLDNNLLTEIDKLFLCSENKEKSAKLKGSLIGKDREDYILFLFENFKFK